MKNNFILFLFILYIFSTCNLSSEIYKEGKLSYENKCASCHGIHGEGFGKLYPNLMDVNYITNHRNQLSCWILKGIGQEPSNAKTTRFSDQIMPKNPDLSAIEICNILNYLNKQYWSMPEFKLSEIEKNIAACK
ncbi:MAG: cytochrome c [Saprospiraceae bacterium]|nr:cytochrome c [Saprospiraceae bacterium]